MKTTDLKIYVEVFEMLRTMDKYIVNFPKDIKHTYGNELRRIGIEIIKNICIANESVLNQSRRIFYLEMAYGNYEAYKICMRLVYHTKALTKKHMVIIGEFIGKIGPMIVKWKQNAQSRSEVYSNAVKSDDLFHELDILQK